MVLSTNGPIWSPLVGKELFSQKLTLQGAINSNGVSAWALPAQAASPPWAWRLGQGTLGGQPTMGGRLGETLGSRLAHGGGA